ncbi:hypothetical protein [Catellatospora chokoriensis]|uniref:Uncharacterized protein n=1 Tax=Catellatospora chokoriensis TaxID=310353 RepID=A0A8J3K501_9ACTN|nr:hypothetical protein [Catellatospora chokoriensis]GIF90765.1 hypothetical protein Cch02nite_42090 [Catellatospora chokoriensis]
MSTGIDAAHTGAATGPDRIASRAQFALAGVYFLAVAVALARAAQFSGRLYLPHQGDEFTGNADLWPGALAVVWLALMIVMSSVPLLSGLMALFALAQLASARVRADRRRRRTLLASTVLSALVVAASFTPQAQTVLGWLLD